jgi:hypothetical protein
MRIPFLLAATSFVFVSMTAANAQSPQPLPPVNLGFTSFVDGAPPAGPGLYFQEYVQFYGAHQIVDNAGNQIPLPGTNLDVWVSLSQFIYMWDIDLGGGAQPALDILIPAIATDLDFSAPVAVPSSSNGGIGDLLIGPAIQFAPIMGEHGPLFMHRVEAQFVIPTGEYNPDHQINAGSNFFSFNPYWAGTLFVGPKTSATFRVHYLWNDTNNDPFTILGPGATTTRAGEAFHMNFGVSHEVFSGGGANSTGGGPPAGPKVRVGINGYYLQQTTDPEINGVEIPGARERAFGIGPGALISFSPKQHIFLNAYWEDGVRNRPEGFRLTLRYTQKF